MYNQNPRKLLSPSSRRGPTSFFPLWAGSTSGFVLLAWQRIKLEVSSSWQPAWYRTSWLRHSSCVNHAKLTSTFAKHHVSSQTDPDCDSLSSFQASPNIFRKNFKQPECAREQEGLFVHYCKSWPKIVFVCFWFYCTLKVVRFWRLYEFSLSREQNSAVARLHAYFHTHLVISLNVYAECTYIYIFSTKKVLKKDIYHYDLLT